MQTTQSWRRAARAALFAVAVALAPACGGDGDGAREDAQAGTTTTWKHLGGLRLVTQHAEWAIVVCLDVADWIDHLNDHAAPLPRQGAGLDPVELRAQLETFFADALGHTERLERRIHDYQHPLLEGGEETAATFRERIAAAKALLATAAEEVGAFPVSDGDAVQAALDRAQSRIDEAVQTLRLAYADMEKNGPIDLRLMFGQRDECIPIFSDSPTGPAPVPPHTR